MPKQFEAVPKSIFDYNFDPINGIVRENDLLTKYTLCLKFLMVQTSCHLDEYNSSYDLNNRNYSSLGDYYETDFRYRIVPLL